MYKYSNYPDLNRGGNMANDNYNEYMLSADGSDVKQLQATVDSLSKQIQDLSEKRNSLQSSITYWDQYVMEHQPYWEACDYKSWKNTNNKYDCGDKFRPESWWNAEKELLEKYSTSSVAAKAEIAKINTDLPALKTQLDSAASRLNVAKEANYMQSMTPEQRAAYEASKTQAKAQADALKKSAEIQAQAQAQATVVKAKQRKIIVVGAAVALVAGVVMYFVFKKKGVKVPVK